MAELTIEARLRQTLAKSLGWRMHAAEVSSLSGGITNENFRVDLEGASYAVRIYGRNSDLLGIDRGHEAACQRAASTLGVAPEVLHVSSEESLLVTRFVPGPSLTGALALEPGRLWRILGELRLCHEQACFPGCFSAFDTVGAYMHQAAQRGVVLPETWPELSGRLDIISRALKPHSLRRACHNDLLPSNFIDDDSRIWIVDWEYAASGELMFDLGNLAVNCEMNDAQCEQLVSLYFGTVTRKRLAQLHLMRLASDMRDAAWAFLQKAISCLDFDYLAYALKHHERFAVITMTTRVDGWLRDLA